MPTSVLDNEFDKVTTASSDMSLIEEQCELELMALEMDEAAFTEKSYIDREALLDRIQKNQK